VLFKHAAANYKKTARASTILVAEGCQKSVRESRFIRLASIISKQPPVVGDVARDGLDKRGDRI